MIIDRPAIKANCQGTLKTVHPEHRDALTAITLSLIGRSSELSWAEIEKVMKEAANENEFRSPEADVLNLADLTKKLEFTRVDGELCITEPTNSERFGIAAVLGPQPASAGKPWGVQVLEPGSYDVLAESAFETLNVARDFTAKTLATDWRMDDNHLVRR